MKANITDILFKIASVIPSTCRFNSLFLQNSKTNNKWYENEYVEYQIFYIVEVVSLLQKTF